MGPDRRPVPDIGCENDTGGPGPPRPASPDRDLLRPRPRRSRRSGRPSSASMRGAARQTPALARDWLRAVAAAGKTCRGARRADGTRVHLLGVAEHGGHLLDHLEVDVRPPSVPRSSLTTPLSTISRDHDVQRPEHPATTHPANEDKLRLNSIGSRLTGSFSQENYVIGLLKYVIATGLPAGIS